MGGTVGVPADFESGKSSLQAPNDNDRLFASVDEALFRYEDTSASYGVERSRSVDPRRLSRDDLDIAGFFLTTASRAPDVNLFNQPRISIWPIHRDTSEQRRTPYDRLIAFCSSYGGDAASATSKPGFRYHFLRADSRSSTKDLDPTNVVGQNNIRLRSYLDRLMKSPIPGYGASFVDKYGDADAKQTAFLIMDYIRAMNLYDTSTQKIVPFGKDPSVAAAKPADYNWGAGEVIPLASGSQKGFGRFSTVSEVAVMFIYRREQPGGSAGVPSGVRRVWMQAILLIEPFSPAQGFAMYWPKHSYVVEGLGNLRIENARTAAGATPGDLGFYLGAAPSGLPTASFSQNDFPGFGWHQRGWGGASTPVPLIPNINDAGRWNQATWSPSNPPPYQLCSKDFYVDVSSAGGSTSKMRMQGAGGPGTPINLKIRIKNSAEELQSIDLEFPAIDLPLPRDTGTFLADGAARDLKEFRNRRFLANVDSSKNPKAWAQFIQPGDVIRSLEINPNSPLGGDLRLYALKKDIPVRASAGGEKYYVESPLYSNLSKNLVHGLCTPTGLGYRNDDWTNAFGVLVKDAKYAHSGYSDEPFTRRPNLSSRFKDGVKLRADDGVQLNGDWDTGVGVAHDGPHIGKADDGQVDVKGYLNQFRYPYFSEQRDPPGPSYFTPNRVATSAVMFGSLPTGGSTGKPWQTLLFNPGPAAGRNHPGFKSPPDHVLLDFFHMPVVEPYAISEPFSTAGKINLNYQILPFTYLKRTTAVHALLKASRVMWLGMNDASVYKNDPNKMRNIRVPVDVEETLKGFDERFESKMPYQSGRTFKSASELAEVYLVPDKKKYSQMNSFWTGVETALTGDNMRERPYANIYPRVTTKSNTYTVHVRAQVLNKDKSLDHDEWDESKESVASEYRGSATIERYIDAGDPTIPDYAVEKEESPFPSLDKYYRFRVIASKRFTP
jgi:uncharacterized protein (TIGR02600 family)